MLTASTLVAALAELADRSSALARPSVPLLDEFGASPLLGEVPGEVVFEVEPLHLPAEHDFDGGVAQADAAPGPLLVERAWTVGKAT